MFFLYFDAEAALCELNGFGLRCGLEETKVGYNFAHCWLKNVREEEAQKFVAVLHWYIGNAFQVVPLSIPLIERGILLLGAPRL